MNKRLYRAALAKKGMTQEQLAKELGVAPSTLIRKIKNNTITMLEAEKISEVLELEAPEVIFFT